MINASCGPAFLNILANRAMPSRTARTANPATTGINGNPNIETSLFHSSRLFASCDSLRNLYGAAACKPYIALNVGFKPACLGARELFPTAHVRNSLLVPLDDHFGALLDGFAVIAARAGAAAYPAERENHFACALLANGHADRAHRPFNPVVRLVQLRVTTPHQFQHELENHPAREKPRKRRESQRRDRH